MSMKKAGEHRAMSQNDKAKGRLLVVSGYSGVGKGTVIKALMKQSIAIGEEKPESRPLIRAVVE